MSVDSRHIATFLLGAAAALGAHKYMSMTPEEKEKLAASIKSKAHSLKTEAEGAADKAKEYFEELKTKGADALKEHFPEVETMFNNLFNPSEKDATTATDPNAGKATT